MKNFGWDWCGAGGGGRGGKGVFLNWNRTRFDLFSTIRVSLSADVSK